jgi:hypothetical protein
MHYLFIALDKQGRSLGESVNLLENDREAIRTARIFRAHKPDVAHVCVYSGTEGDWQVVTIQ